MDSKNKFPLIFRFSYKLEKTLVYVVIFFLLILLVSLAPIKSFYRFKNKISKSIIRGKMVVSELDLPGRKGGPYIAIGHLISNNKISDKTISVHYNYTNYNWRPQVVRYINTNYGKIQVGDTLNIWHNSSLGFVEIAPEGGVEELIDLRKKNVVATIVFTLNMFLVVLVPYIILRISRKFLQRKHNISKEEFIEYKKIAFKKK